MADHEDAQAAKELAELTASAHKALANIAYNHTPPRGPPSPQENAGAATDEKSQPRKRAKRSLKSAVQSIRVPESNVIQLLDKDVDVSRLSATASLYAMCRLWMSHNTAEKEEPLLAPDGPPADLPLTRNGTHVSGTHGEANRGLAYSAAVDVATARQHLEHCIAEGFESKIGDPASVFARWRACRMGGHAQAEHL